VDFGTNERNDVSSETKWTPEPWVLATDTKSIIMGPRDDSGERSLIAGAIKDVREVFDATPPSLPETERIANSARIVACVNACRDLNPSAIPGLVEAVRKIAYEPFGHPEEDHKDILDAITWFARAALASATKEVVR